jgi:hypothetical protein
MEGGREESEKRVSGVRVKSASFTLGTNGTRRRRALHEVPSEQDKERQEIRKCNARSYSECNYFQSDQICKNIVQLYSHREKTKTEFNKSLVTILPARNLHFFAFLNL